MQLSFQFQTIGTQRQADGVLRVAAHAYLNDCDGHLPAVTTQAPYALFLMRLPIPRWRVL